MNEKKEKWMPVAAGLVYSDEEDLLCEIFHENTNITLKSEILVGAKIGMILSIPMLNMAFPHSYKVYRGVPKTDLVPVCDFEKNATPLEDSINRRRSLREYTGESISLQDISKMLFYSYGITGEVEAPGGFIQKLRATASGGALYPLELYAICSRVESIDAGLYHYDVMNHRLEQLKKGDLIEELVPIIMGAPPDMIRSAAAIIVISSVFRRSTFKYGSRGYRYILLEAGGVCEHIQLTGTSLHLGVCQVAGYYDDEINRFLGFDGVNEAVLNLCVIGKPRASE